MTNYEAIYPGATYLLDPNYGFMGYRVPAGEFGGTTSIQTANQLKEVNNLLNQGMKTTEVSVVQPEVFEMMPKGHLKEIARLNKLTGAESTLHAPVIDPSGFTQQGWSEENREVAERQFESFVERGHELSPEGNMPVTIHASSIPGSEMIPETHKLVLPEEKGKGPVIGKMIAVNQDTGELIPLERKKVYGPRKPKGEIWTPETELTSANATKFSQAITNLAFYKKEADEIIAPAQGELSKNLMIAGNNPTQTQINQIKISQEKLQRGDLFLTNIEQSFRSLYEQAAKYGTDENTKKVLDNISKNWIEKTKAMQNEKEIGEVIKMRTNLIDNSLNEMRKLEQTPPKIFKPIEEFAKDKASETLSNVAVNTYKKFGNTSPIISVENPPYGSALSSGEDLKNLIKETRKKFVNKLVKEGKSKSNAEQAAEKLIGVTWDTSHISMIRKQGFNPEQVVKETKTIAPYVKHVHFNDNFGSTHTDLPPGMGNLPMPEIMGELEKAKFKGKKIFEGGNWFQHMQTSPFPYQLESAGSPLYSTAPAASPYWNQIGGLGAYYSGTGPINPAIHHSTYGAGFTNLPIELGGEMPGTQSRFSGTPNQ